MVKPVLKTICLLCEFIWVVASFIVWEFFSNGAWRRRKKLSLQPARLLQDEAVYLRSQIRKLEDQHRMSIAELERHYQAKLKSQALKEIIN